MNRKSSEVTGNQRAEYLELSGGRVAADLRRRWVTNRPVRERLSEVSCAGLEVVGVGTGPPWRALYTASVEPVVPITGAEVRHIDCVPQLMGENSSGGFRCVSATNIDLDDLVVRECQATKRRVRSAVADFPTRQSIAPLERKHCFGGQTDVGRVRGCDGCRGRG